jgi:hypothetical protein
MPKTNSFPVGSQVVFNHLVDATVFEVIESDGGFRRTIRESGRPNYAPQLVDVSTCRVPTDAQIAMHAANVQGNIERHLNYLHGV